MAKISDLTHETRKNQVIKALTLMNEGMSQKDACEQVGITPRTFRNYRDEDPEGLMLFQGLFTQTNREMLSKLLTERVGLMLKLIEDGLSEDTRPADRLAIVTQLEDFICQISQEARIDSSDSSAAEEVLSGPRLVPAQSRFSVAKEGNKIIGKIDTSGPSSFRFEGGKDITDKTPKPIQKRGTPKSVLEDQPMDWLTDPKISSEDRIRIRNERLASSVIPCCLQSIQLLLGFKSGFTVNVVLRLRDFRYGIYYAAGSVIA